MALAKYANACSKNAPGFAQLFISEVANITSFTITSGEISTVTMASTNKFREIQCDQDTITVKTAIAGKYVTGATHEISFGLSKATKDLNAFIGSLQAALPCGVVAIVVDNNGIAWAVGYDQTNLLSRPLNEMDTNFDGGLTPIEADKNKWMATLKGMNAEPLTRLDSTLSGTLTAGTATWVDWN